MPPNMPQMDQNSGTLLQRLAKMLGLAPDAGEDEILETLATHLVAQPLSADEAPDPRKFVPQMTYKQVIADVAAHVPPERRTSISAVHRWWRKHAPQS
jgi:hypothetical protein